MISLSPKFTQGNHVGEQINYDEDSRKVEKRS